jgi:rhodanese-related sulfurtransferase
MIGKSIGRLISVLFLLVFGITMAAAKDVPRMTVDELKALLGTPDVVILDVRINSDWNRSTEKIMGAVREDPSEVKVWAKKYSKEKTLVLYCA